MRHDRGAPGLRRVIAVALLIIVAVPSWAGAADRPGEVKRVLIIHSFGQHFEPFSSVAAVLRTELAQQSPEPVDFYEVSVETARFAEGAVDAPLADYIRALNERLPLDLVVPVGSPAVRFCARHREDMPGIPIVVAGAENRFLAAFGAAPNVTGAGFTAEPAGFVENVLTALPDTRRIGVVFGTSPVETYWLGECRREFAVFEGRVAFDWLVGLSLADLQARVAGMPPNSAVLFAFFNMDANGVPYEQDAALAALQAAADAPIFGMFQTQVGAGIVGGRLVDSPLVGKEAAQIAIRILGGEPAGAIPWVTVPRTVPTYDWRELQRWGIPEDRLPAGSVVLFRQPGAWDAWRGRIIVLAAVVVLQAVLIAMLLSGRKRLVAARAALRENERSLVELQRELSHAGRVSLLGQVTASLAHELGQPLGAILRNAEAAELFIRHPNPDLDELRAILADVRRDGARAGNVIDRLRALLQRRSIDMQSLAWGALVDDVVGIVKGDAAARGVDLQVNTAPGLPAVRGDRVHLQQVLINLVANAMDACESVPGGERRVRVETRSRGDGFVECTVSDTGPGVVPEHREGIFDPFMTTRPNGMGMGLPISKTIVETHGGRLWVADDTGGGAVFHFTLPVATA